MCLLGFSWRTIHLRPNNLDKLTMNANTQHENIVPVILLSPPDHGG
jgi:hypothetical protein